MLHDLTKGNLFSILIKFTLPLFLVNILQLTYNAVDSIIVGKFVSSTALAAVGTSNPVMTLVIMFVQGITLGSSILIGNFFGARNYDQLKKQISTAMISGTIFSALMALLIVVFAGDLLSILQVDESILPMAAGYLRIVGAGLIFSYIYNFFANTLRALGDSRSPLYFLAISAVLNIFGDLLLVVVFHMGITGCAISTVICEALSCLLCWIYIVRKVPLLNMGREWLRFDGFMLKRTLQYGTVSAIQQSTVQMGIVGVQGLVNSLGAVATAAFAAANRIDDFALIPGRSIANAMTSVMAQNVGAGKKKRVFKAFQIGMGIEIFFGVIAGILLLVLANPLMVLFTDDPAVIQEGETYLHLIALMYVLPAVTNGLQGYFRGVGDLKITLISSLINMGSRFASCMVYIKVLHLGIRSVPFACMTGWVVMIIYEVPYLIQFHRRMNREKDEPGDELKDEPGG